ncbi:MAG: hypothetical protein QOJ62_2731 [Actinomycetota bacterium]|jgi:hypothetical protein|nr:hypothetical protein [Actinomycetota bacterium]
MTSDVRRGSRDRLSQVFVPPLLWAAIVAVGGIAFGLVTGAYAGGAIGASCKGGGPCSAVDFDWQSAVHAGVRATLMIVIVGYLVIVAVRALVRFAAVESPGDPPSDP